MGFFMRRFLDSPLRNLELNRERLISYNLLVKVLVIFEPVFKQGFDFLIQPLTVISVSCSH